jgi:hypothetical protein
MMEPNAPSTSLPEPENFCMKKPSPPQQPCAHEVQCTPTSTPSSQHTNAPLCATYDTSPLSSSSSASPGRLGLRNAPPCHARHTYFARAQLASRPSLAASNAVGVLGLHYRRCNGVNI